MTRYIGFNSYCNAGQTYNMTLQDVIDYGYDIGLSDYPIWDEGKREWLNRMITDHFMMREIRAETPEQFIVWLNRLMNENMLWINTVFCLTYDVDANSLKNDVSIVSSNVSGTKTDEKGSSTDHSDDSASVSGSSASYASTNPRQTMIGKDATEYYDSGSKTDTSSSTSSEADSSSTTDSTTVSDSSSNTRTEGYSNVNISDWLDRWSGTINNGLTLVFKVLEPAFCQIYTDHFDVW